MVTGPQGESVIYSYPFPPITSVPGYGEWPCGAVLQSGSSTFWCTRERAHEGRHESGGPTGQMYASWPRPTAEVTFADGARQ